jgi:ketosteroid isomerase-like protein
VELIDLGERIVTLADGSMRAQASGVPLSQAFALVTTLREGRPIRHQEYYDHGEALEAAGLRE